MFLQFVDARVTIILAYVEDIILTSNDFDYIKELTLSLNNWFILKDLGNLSYFLGIQIIRNSKKIHLNQHNYIAKLHVKSELAYFKPTKSLICIDTLHSIILMATF